MIIRLLHKRPGWFRYASIVRFDAREIVTLGYSGGEERYSAKTGRALGVPRSVWRVSRESLAVLRQLKGAP